MLYRIKVNVKVSVLKLKILKNKGKWLLSEYFPEFSEQNLNSVRSYPTPNYQRQEDNGKLCSPNTASSWSNAIASVQFDIYIINT
jgi:hypothetical protein